jgi:hypothetical protein
MADQLTERYRNLLDGGYDCVDRIVLNAYFTVCHSGGGFRHWWRRLMDGSDEQLDNAHLMRMAGRFSRRVRGFAKALRLRLSTVAEESASTILLKNTSPPTRSNEACFLFLSRGRLHRSGMSDARARAARY